VTVPLGSALARAVYRLVSAPLVGFLWVWKLGIGLFDLAGVFRLPSTSSSRVCASGRASFRLPLPVFPAKRGHYVI